MTTLVAPPAPARERPSRQVSSAPPAPRGPALPRLIRTNADIVHIGPQRIRLGAPDGRSAELSGPGVLLLRRMLTLMNGRRSTERLLISLPQADRPAVRQVLARLLDTGLLCECAADGGLSRRVAVVGSGRLAARLRTQLGRVGRVQAYGDALPGGFRGFDDSGGIARHWTELADTACDLVIWAPLGCLPDPAMIWALVCSGTPHLLVSADQARGQVSPLVIPGITACLECQSGHRRWPREAQARARLVSRRAAPRPATLDWAVGVTEALTLAHLRSGLPTRGSDIEGRTLLPSRPDPECGFCATLVARPRLPIAA